NHKGPYMPIIISACKEDQLAYEYKDGNTAYGAFTYALVNTMRNELKKNKNLNYKELFNLTKHKVQSIGIQQEPVLFSRKGLAEQVINWINN
ncbi:MAG TPA: caspase family protein, partial [Vampirovibrionales bacterium]